MRATPAANISTALRNLLLWPLLAFAVGLADQFADAVRRTSPRQPDPSAGKSESSNSRWTAAAGLAVVGAAGLLAAPPAIEEGMNAFFPGYPQDAALRQDLPAEFHDKSLQLFDATYRPGEAALQQSSATAGLAGATCAGMRPVQAASDAGERDLAGNHRCRAAPAVVRPQYGALRTDRLAVHAAWRRACPSGRRGGGDRLF